MPDNPEVAEQEQTPESKGFRLSTTAFAGPLDLLLQLISAKKLDITDVALAEVTDEFIAYTKALGEQAPLDEITEFLLIAATLLDLKAARLLPRNEDYEIEDLDLLESRDLLFARLLQYRAYKQVAELFATWQQHAQHRYPREVSLEPRFAQLLPPVNLGMNAFKFAEFAAAVFKPKPAPVVGTGHIHQVAVSVPEQAGILLTKLKIVGAGRPLSFQELTADAATTMVIVGRFLALLELYRAKAVEIEQEESLGLMQISWTGLDVDPAVVAAANWE